MKLVKIVLVLISLSFVYPTLVRAENSSDSVDLGRVVVTASRMAQHDYKVSSNVTVIGQEEISQSTAKNVKEVLEQQMGVNVYDSGSDKSATVDIRGFGDTASRNVLILVNDRKVNSIDISGTDLLQIPLGSVDRIEIIRGSNSVLYGDNAVGGVINIITKEGKGDLHVRAGVSAGSYGTKIDEAEIGGSAKKFSYYFYSQYYDTDGYRDNSQLLSKDFNGRFGYKLSDRNKVSLATTWHKDDYGLPGGLTDAEIAQLGRRGSADFNDTGSTKDRSVQLTLDTTPWPENINWGRFVTDVSFRNRDSYANFAAYDFGTKRNIDTYGVTEKYIFNQKILDRDFNLVAGLDYYDVDNGIRGSGSNTDDLTITKKEWGLYLSAEAELVEKIYLNAGTRYQKADYIFDQRGSTPGYSTQKAEAPVSMVGSRYEYAKGSNVFFNVQQNFRFLATDEWYSSWTGLNTNLKQQDGIQYEAGVKHNLNDVSLITFTPYLLNLKNEIYYDPKAGGGWGDNGNYGKTRRIGFDFGHNTNLLKFFNAPVFSRWEFSTNYSYELPQFRGGDNDGKIIPMAPKNQLDLGLEFEFKKKYRVALLGHYVGSRYAINDTANETPQLKGYWVCDTKFSYNQKWFEAFLSLNNIFNEKYYSYATKSVSSSAKDYFPAPTFNILAGMSVKF